MKKRLFIILLLLILAVALLLFLNAAFGANLSIIWVQTPELGMALTFRNLGADQSERRNIPDRLANNTYSKLTYKQLDRDYLERKLSQRTKSVGDMLNSRSLSEHVVMEHSVPGTQGRPKSLYEESSSQLVNGAAQPPPVDQWPRSQYPSPQSTPKHQFQTYSLPQSYPGEDQLYQPVLYGDVQLQRGRPDYPQSYPAPGPYASPHGRPRALPPSPTIPAPPPPSQPTSNHSHSMTSQHQHVMYTSSMHARTPSMRRSAPQPPPGPPPQAPAPPPPAAPSVPPAPPAPPAPPPPPPPPPPPAPSTSVVKPSPKLGKKSNVVMSSLPSQNASSSPFGNGVPSPSNFGSPSRQPSHKPGTSRQQPPEPDYNGIEEDTNYQTNPMFANVTLRKAKTNDRSAPKI